MTDMDGIQLVKELRKLPECKLAAIIALTTESRRIKDAGKEESRGLRAGLQSPLIPAGRLPLQSKAK